MAYQETDMVKGVVCGGFTQGLSAPPVKERPGLEQQCVDLSNVVGQVGNFVGDIESLVFASPRCELCSTKQACPVVVTIGTAMEVSIDRLTGMRDRLAGIEKALRSQFGDELRLLP